MFVEDDQQQQQKQQQRPLASPAVNSNALASILEPFPAWKGDTATAEDPYAATKVPPAQTDGKKTLRIDSMIKYQYRTFLSLEICTVRAA